MKKYLSFAILLVMALSLSACSKNSSQSQDTSPSKTTTEVSNDDYIGLSVEDAQKLADKKGERFRVIGKDGEALPVTLDYVVGRINAIVEGDIVVSYQVEGQENSDESSDSADYIGMTVDEAKNLAKKNGVRFRVVIEDGESKAITKDIREGRINATVESGIVINYAVEQR